MVESPISGNKDPSSVEGGYKYIPIGSAEEASQVGYQQIGEPVKDRLEISEKELPKVPPCECDKPAPPPPDKVKTSEAHQKEAVKAIQTNPWLSETSFISSFAAVIFKLLNLQKRVQYEEAQRALAVQGKTFELTTSNAGLAKAITFSQADEKMWGAYGNFISAGISAISFVDTSRNLGKATKKFENDVKDTKQKLVEEQDKYLGAKATDKNNPQAIDDMIKQRKNEKWDGPDGEKVKELEKELATKESQKERNILDHERTLSQLSQMKMETLKQSFQGFTAVQQAAITYERGRLEEIKGLNDAQIQLYNKQQEKWSKGADDAKQMFDRFADFLTRMIQSSYDAHRIGRS